MTLYLTIGGRSWVVDRREETPARAGGLHGVAPRLYLYFAGADGELRRNEIADTFPEEPTAALLERVWRTAEVVRAGAPGEMHSHRELVLPRWRDVVRLTWRAVTLRCPNCGQARAVRSWFHVRHECPACGIRLDRGEDEDYYLGGIFFNIMFAEALFAVLFALVVAVMWPDVPWTAVEYVMLAAMIIAPVLLYPVSRILWLAVDLMFRPPDDAEMAWHAAAHRDDD